jgi:branched-chain amino acid transport system substrate-binding protein
MSNVWGMDESMPPLCGPLNASNPCFDRVHVVLPFAAYGDTRAAEMTKVLALHDKRRLADNDGSSYRNVRYVQGYTNVLLLKMAVEKILAENNAITGENIKAALETFSGKATAGLTNPLTFTSTDHRPQSGGTIYKFDVNGKLVLEFERNIAMQGDWLGW